MMIKDVIFPEPLLNALRDGRLVVFAGAGVSMESPAELPSFRKLAERVADGTGQSRARKDHGKVVESETEDQFLGRLEDCKGKESHQLATKLLHSNNPVLFQRTEACFISSTPLIQAGSPPPTSTACLSRKREAGAECKENQSVHTPYILLRRPQ